MFLDWKTILLRWQYYPKWPTDSMQFLQKSQWFFFSEIDIENSHGILRVFLTNGAGKTGYLNAKEWNWILTTQHIKNIVKNLNVSPKMIIKLLEDSIYMHWKTISIEYNCSPQNGRKIGKSYTVQGLPRWR